ncbi:MAG: hypothetical protein AB7U79_00615 [Candidatus Izemoplasmatales bacterium]
MRVFSDIGFIFSGITILLYIYQISKRNLPNWILYIPSVVMGFVGILFVIMIYVYDAQGVEGCIDYSIDTCMNYQVVHTFWGLFIFLALLSSVFNYLINRFFKF